MLPSLRLDVVFSDPAVEAQDALRRFVGAHHKP